MAQVVKHWNIRMTWVRIPLGAGLFRVFTKAFSLLANRSLNTSARNLIDKLQNDILGENVAHHTRKPAT